MTRQPDVTKLANDLSQRISNYTVNPGTTPLKLLQWALSQLQECARTQSIPPPKVMDVVMRALVNTADDLQQHQRKPQQRIKSGAQGTATDGDDGAQGDVQASQAEAVAATGTTKATRIKGGVVAKRPSSRSSSSKNNRGPASGGLKGKVVFTPLYGCDEGATGVGPVCSILEVSLASSGCVIENVAHFFPLACQCPTTLTEVSHVHIGLSTFDRKLTLVRSNFITIDPSVS